MSTLGYKANTENGHKANTGIGNIKFNRKDHLFMTKKQTIDFIHWWNKKNNLPDGVCASDNMRYVKNGVVEWNIYDSPEVKIKEWVSIYKKVTKK